MVALIQCGKSKQRGFHPARELYTGALFKRSYQYAKALKCEVYILSAKHGLVHESRVIPYYDETLNTFSAVSLDTWGQKVAIRIDPKWSLLVLAGERYKTFLRYTSNEFDSPLDGLPIGRRLQWLNTNLRRLQDA